MRTSDCRTRYIAIFEEIYEHSVYNHLVLPFGTYPLKINRLPKRNFINWSYLEPQWVLHPTFSRKAFLWSCALSTVGTYQPDQWQSRASRVHSWRQVSPPTPHDVTSIAYTTYGEWRELFN